ncbi:MAG: HNH endonuclease [Polyangiales bacterium]
MSSQVLVLTAAMEPHRVVPWQRAIHLVFMDKVEVLEEYDEILYRSRALTIRMPAVVRLRRVLRGITRAVRFSRLNVFTRDRFCCQYCGARKPMRELSYDHVLPRNQGGRTAWENIVTSCYPCNSKKRNRTPDQAGMSLLSMPCKPRSLPVRRQLELGGRVPHIWNPYVSWWMDPNDANVDGRLDGGADEVEVQLDARTGT